MALAVGLSAVAAFLFSGCGDDAGARLDKLLGAPMADYELGQAIETTRSEVKGSTGTNPTPSRIITSYFVEEGGLDGAFDEVLSSALTAGYVNEESRSERAYSGSQDINGQRVTIDIVRSTAENKIQVTLLTRS